MDVEQVVAQYKRTLQELLRERHRAPLSPEREAEIAEQRREIWHTLPARVAAELEMWIHGWMTFGPRIVDLEARLEAATAKQSGDASQTEGGP